MGSAPPYLKPHEAGQHRRDELLPAHKTCAKKKGHGLPCPWLFLALSKRFLMAQAERFARVGIAALLHAEKLLGLGNGLEAVARFVVRRGLGALGAQILDFFQIGGIQFGRDESRVDSFYIRIARA
jgi:hypothetical protein